MREFLSTITNRINGYKIVTRLTPDEWKKYIDDWVTQSAFRSQYGSSFELVETWDTYLAIANDKKKELDEYVQTLHTKYNTNSKHHAVYKKCIVERKRY